MARIEKEEVCHVMARGVNIMWQTLIFNCIIYIDQLYKEDCTILQIFWAVGP